MKDKNKYYQKKFKFGEFGKFSEQQAQNMDSTLKPILPNSQTGYGSYDNTNNQSESNQGYGYDEYASDFRGSNGNSASKNNTYSYSYSGGYSNADYSNGYTGGNGSSTTTNSRVNNGNAYGYNSDDINSSSARYSQRNRDKYSSTSTKERRPKQNTYASSNSYGYEPDENTGNSGAYSNSYTSTSTGLDSSNANNDTESSQNNYGYEPSINNYSSSNGYGFDPYSDTGITAKSTEAPLSKTKTSNTTSTYDPYAPGEEPYKNDSSYGGYEPDLNAYNDNDNNNNNNNTNNFNDNDTITDSQAVNALSSGVQGLQLQKEQTQQQQQQQDEDDFDPYGPSASLHAQQQSLTQTQTQATRTYTQNQDLDMNEYEPTPEMQEQDTPYDEDEFEEDVDEDEEELNRIQRQTKDVREDTVNLSRTLVDNLGQANVTATNTLGVLGNQREKIYEMESNIGTMKVQQRFVDDHVKDLEHYNRSLFHIKVNNPFTRNSRRKAKEQAFLAQRQDDRNNKDKLNSELYQSQRAIMDQLNNDNVKSDLQEKYDYDRRIKEASKYLTKDHDEEDERMEVEIAANIEHAQKLANNLKKKANLMNKEVDDQNQNLKKVSENVDFMDDKIVMTTRRIRGI
ncbi:Meiosis-specific subunit of the t-SNARE complex [Pichia californica]|uniref:Meiosis-specific subunit of the t-SNARE complex n=1 Tax=Pichia californica TaxID=460514 RepID=A0A9P7BHR5_9ASCO|nr:Meiosis-specific subunit of the t-SNARE complex [[Candida] californica]